MRNLVTYVLEWIMLNKFKAAIAAALLLFVVGSAFAGSANLSWTHPTTDKDGKPLTVPILGTRIEWGSCAGSAFGTKAGEQLVSGTGNVLTVNNLTPGTVCFRGFSQTSGGEGLASNVVSRVIPAPLPGAPTLTVVSVVAYDVKWSWKDRSFVLNRQVGTVPIGTACIADFTLDGGYARVERQEVKLTSRAKSPVIVAKCA